MSKDLHISIMSDDSFSRNWMSLLIVRDWRTRLMLEMDCQANPYLRISQAGLTCDFIVVDLDSLISNPGLLTTLNSQEIEKKPIKLLGVSSELETRFLKRMNPELLAGYLLKDEIGNSLAWALTFGADNKTVFTPSTLDIAQNLGITLINPPIVLRKRAHHGITDRQKDIAKMAIVYSIGRRDLADELKISDQWSYSMVSELYESLGLANLASGEETSLMLLQDDPKITRKLNKIIKDLGHSKKARDLETLAFHLLTLPIIED